MDRKHILIVDDEPEIRLVCSAILRDAGLEISCAANGVEAMSLFSQARADVVLTDMLMPEMDGLETILALRRESPKPKIVAMSAGGRIAAEECLSMASKLGVAAILEKPFSADALVSAVTSALQIVSA